MEPGDLEKHLLRQLTYLRGMTAIVGSVLSQMCAVLFEEELTLEQREALNAETAKKLSDLLRDLTKANEEATRFLIAEEIIKTH